MSHESLEKLITLLNLGSKREVERYCRNLVITSEDLTDLIIAGRIAGLGPYKYACHFHDIRPESLEPTEEQLAALGKSEVGPLKGPALKAIRKFSQTYRDRKLVSVHLFYDRSQKYWHMFYFDQRDRQLVKNHWKHGPHIHYSQDTFVGVPLAEVWQKVVLDAPEFPPSVHIRYDYHHNRRSA